MFLARRTALLGVGALFAAGRASLALAAAPTERRFVVVNLRGALDGLAAVAPYGDPDLAALRGELLSPPPGQPDGLLDLGGFFGLHPLLTNLHAMFVAGEMTAIHAVAGPYRARSHFEAQDCLESGADRRLASGWLNRAIGGIGGTVGSRNALAIGVSAPLLLRGPAPVGNWAPHIFTAPASSLYAAIAALNEADIVTGPAIAEGLRGRGFATTAMGEEPKDKYAFPALATAAGEMLRAPNGARIAALELGGWDTHAQQIARLAGPLRQLDAGMAALKTALGPIWRQTCVLIMTEFGRTARLNGTKGTDHGTAGIAFVAGGATAGGAIRVDWPGLRAGSLLDDRDLQPTTDLRSVAKGLLAEQFGLAATELDAVFPDSRSAAPLRGLIRA
jgi:uncharacterized protein (DUF1501 family)